MTEEQLKYYIKEKLGFKRTPRDITTYYVFMLVRNIHEAIKEVEGSFYNSEMFVSTTILQQRFKIHGRTYAPYFKSLISGYEDESYSINLGLARTIKSWSPLFDEMYNETRHIEIHESIYKQYVCQTESINNDVLDFIKNSINKTTTTNHHSVMYLTSLDQLKQQLINNNNNFYVSTKSSPFRKYHFIQSIPKELRKEVFKGCYDIDLEQAFASITWNELDFKNSSIDNGWMLNPECKKDFRRVVQKEFNLKSESEAKTQICYLFSKEYTHSWGGPKWFDDLHKSITEKIRTKLYKEVEWKGKKVEIDTFHKFFTFHEQNIINIISQQNNVVVNMHDGVISKTKPITNTVTYNGGQYKLSVHQF